MDVQTNSWIFQDTTTIGNGTTFKSGRNNQITIYITGDSLSRTILFEGCDGESTPNWFPITAVKLSDLTSATSTTGNNEAWTIDLAQWVGIRCRISAIVGGTVKITGRVVEVENSLIQKSDVILAGSQTKLLAQALNQVVTKGTNYYLTGDVTNYKNKTVQIFSTADGYCGLEINLNNQWRSLSSSQNIIYQDSFVGVDGDALASAWEVTKVGTYTDATTYAKIYGNKMRMNIAGTAGVPKVQAVINKPIYLSREYVIKFVLDETLFTAASASREFKVGITPTKPTTGGTEVGGLTNSKTLLNIYGADAYRTGGVKILDIDTPSDAQEYTIILTATKLKIYRGTTLLCEFADTYDQTQYYVWFQGMVHYTAGPFTFTIDDVMVYNRDVTAKVLAGIPYVKTITDAIAGNMRVNFMADFGADAVVDIAIIGQG
jgi:hypothetical protein